MSPPACIGSPTRSATSLPRLGRCEASGRAVRYLNIGDPIPFGFSTPAALVEAVARAERDGYNGYVPSPGITEAREAVAADWTRQGFPATVDRVLITAGTSEGIELALTAMVDPGDAVLVPMPTYPLYTAVLAKIGAEASYYRTDPSNGWQPDLDHIESLITRARARSSSSTRTIRPAPSIPTPLDARSSSSRSGTGSCSWPTRSTVISRTTVP